MQYDGGKGKEARVHVVEAINYYQMNTYTTKKDGREYYLNPIKDSEVKGEDKSRVCLVSRKKFLRECKKEGNYFSIASKLATIVTSKEEDEIPKEI